MHNEMLCTCLHGFSVKVCQSVCTLIIDFHYNCFMGPLNQSSPVVSYFHANWMRPFVIQGVSDTFEFLHTFLNLI